MTHLPQDPIDDLILALRAVDAPPVRATESTRVRSRRRYLTPAFLVAGGLVVVVSLRPQPALGAPWERVVANTLATQIRHRREFDESGRLTFEMWSAPRRFAYWSSLRGSDQVIYERRDDGRRTYHFDDQTASAGHERSANEIIVGTVRDRLSESSLDPLAPSESLDAFVRSIGGSVTETREGDETVYIVRQTKAHRVYTTPKNWRSVQETYRVRVDGQKRIIEMKTTGDGSRTVFDYPESLPESVFAPRPQRRIVPVIDVQVARKVVRERMRDGMGTQAGVTLRLVVVDKIGAVWILWTGAPPDGRLSRPARIVGVPTGSAFGPKEFTSSRPLSGRLGYSPVIERRLEGHGLTPKVHIGDRLTIQIPTRRGSATFRDVPVLRIASLIDISSEIGL